MHHLPREKHFLGRWDVVLGDRVTAVPPLRILEAGFLAKGVHQPRLADSLRIKALDGRRLEFLTKLGRVLAEQCLDLRSVEIPAPPTAATRR